MSSLIKAVPLNLNSQDNDKTLIGTTHIQQHASIKNVDIHSLLYPFYTPILSFYV